MSRQVQTTPDTSSGSAKTYLEEREQKKKILDKMEKFHSDCEIEKLVAQDNDATPIVEASRELIEHFNRGKLINAFDKVGYFIYQGVMVCETGKKDKVAQALEDSSVLMPDDWNKKKALQ